MTYWLAFPLTLFMLSPIWLDWWGGAYLADKYQVSAEEGWDADSGQVRTSEGVIGPPRN